MYSSRLTSISALAALLSLAATDPNSVCNSFGVDFVDDYQYFINTLSIENFTCVSTFQGCNEGKDLADVLLVDPNGDEYLCSSVPTTPADKPMLSTCPILKSQMISGDWMILVMGNNDDGNPFAWERGKYLKLDCGPQVTSTVTPTITYNITSTPTVMQTTTSTAVFNSTIGPTATFTVPSKTAHRTKTITPTPVTSTIVKTFTRKRLTWTKELSITTKTKTASCTIPPKPTHKDKKCTYSPTLLHPAALASATPTTKAHRYMRRADRAVDVEYARERIEAAKLRRNLKANAAQLEERAPDAPTLTVTAIIPANTTITYTGSPAITSTETVLTSSTSWTSLPPVTVYSGVFTSTITLPTPTRTRMSFSYSTEWVTKTIYATFTRTTTVTPTASVSACRSQGGHWGYGRM
ncbi:hypothetical protein BCR34DRAFT_489155 [Clohesyomyces aquaticus]|uniref:Uncharacterized protein n=1 Tax=Clohesyomyces aquaticus TaxID=1231657 RepID=A0A1Y1ZBZ9_9PLEO|nr:hypothetical protein BCR34DRAFT_489155 [Clohesyomyces aquaticus]